MGLKPSMICPRRVSETILEKATENAIPISMKFKIRVGFLNPETASMRQAEMYVEGFKMKLKKDTSYKGLWIVSFALK